MITSENINELATALASAQGELEDAVKNTQGYGYKYADLAQILQIIRPVLTKHGLAVVQSPANDEGGVCVTTRLIHASGQWIESSLTMPLEIGKGMTTAQAIGAIVTYSRRYQISSMLSISSDADTDAAMKDPRPLAMPRKSFPEEEAALREAAQQGLQPLQDVWKNLTREQHKALIDVKEECKAIALEAQNVSAG